MDPSFAPVAVSLSRTTAGSSSRRADHRGAATLQPDGVLPGAYFDDREKLRSVPALFEHLRATLGPDVELLHDMHDGYLYPNARPGLGIDFNAAAARFPCDDANPTWPVSRLPDGSQRRP